MFTVSRYRWKYLWSKLWSWLPGHPHHLISDDELDRRLRDLNRRLTAAFAARDDEADERFLARLKVSMQRAEADVLVLTTPLPDNPSEADMDRWCAALLREIMRRRAFPHDPNDIYIGIEGAIRTIEAWTSGKDTSAPVKTHPDED
jgi:hypothetical protein